MKTVLIVLLAIHGAIHLMGVAKGFHLAEVAQLKQPIGRGAAWLWLMAASGFLTSAALLAFAPRLWWIAAAPALVASQVAILASWSDAKYGTIANAIVLVPLVVALADQRSTSLRSIYEGEVDRGLARTSPVQIVSEKDLDAFPAAVRTYLRRAGVVGKPRVTNVHVLWKGEFRGAPDKSFSAMKAEQYNFFDPPARLFFMETPFYEGLHVYAGRTATMRVRVASLFQVLDARGPEMDRSETVTMLNDMCLLAPASLIGANITWRELPDGSVSATFVNAGHLVRATLYFDESGDLVNFKSYDRDQTIDGKTFRNLPWSTPVKDYRVFDGVRLASHGEAVWHDPERGDWVYGRFEIVGVHFNVGQPSLEQKERPHELAHAHR